MNIETAGSDAVALGRRLASAYRARSPLEGGWAEQISTITDAYEVQDSVVEAFGRSGEGAPVGYKVGLTTRAMQEFCGVDSPICGRILRRGVATDGTTLRRQDYVRLGLESELALHLAQDIPFEAITSDESLVQQIGSIHAAFEIVDDRGADYAHLSARQIVAENSWNAGIIIGPGASPANFGSLDRITGALVENDQEIGRGTSADVLGGPLEVVRWLSAFLSKRGESLRAGDWIMTGSIVTTKFPESGSRYRFGLKNLSPVSVNVVD